MSELIANELNVNELMPVELLAAELPPDALPSICRIWVSRPRTSLLSDGVALPVSELFDAALSDGAAKDDVSADVDVDADAEVSI